MVPLLMTSIDINVANNLWLVVEACISIIAACLPALRGLFRGQLLSTSFSRYIWGTLTSRWGTSRNTTAKSAHSSTNNTKYNNNYNTDNSREATNGNNDHDWVPLKDVPNGAYGLSNSYSNDHMVGEPKKAYMQDDYSAV